MNSQLIVIYGNVSGGKGTLSKNLSSRISNSVHFCSDDIRKELFGDAGGASRGLVNGKYLDTFVVFNERVEQALKEGKFVIADSTGMSPTFVGMVNEWRKNYPTMLVVRVYCDYKTWQKRELMRDDRLTKDKNSGEIVPFVMPERAYYDSFAAKFEQPASFEINTSNMSPDEVIAEFYWQETLMYQSECSKVDK